MIILRSRVGSRESPSSSSTARLSLRASRSDAQEELELERLTGEDFGASAEGDDIRAKATVKRKPLGFAQFRGAGSPSQSAVCCPGED